MKKIHYLSKVLVLIMLLTASIPSVNSSMYYYKTSYTVSQAMTDALSNSDDIKDINKKIFTKKIAIKQAKKSVSDERKKLARIFEKKPTYPKAYGVATKVQKSEFEYALAQKELYYKGIEIKYATKTLYLSAYLSSQKFEKLSIDLRESEAKVKLAKTQLRSGKIDSQEFERVEKLSEEIKKNYDKVSVKMYEEYGKLGDFVGKSITYNSTNLDFELKEIYLSSNKLPLVIKEGFESDYALYSMGENIKFSINEVNIISRLYNSKFSSSRMSSLNTLINLGVTNIDDLALMTSYENLINNLISKWGDDWKSYYEISLLVISFKIPKLFRSGEFDGVRYLEDSRYALMLKILEAKSFFIQENKLKEAKINYLASLFTNINNQDYELYVLKNELKQKENLYKLNYSKFLRNQIEAADLIELETEINTIYEKVFDTKAKLNFSIIEMDSLTNGYYNELYTISRADINKNIPSPFNRPDTSGILDKINAESKLNIGATTWSMTEVVEGFLSEISIKADDKLGAKSYSIQTVDGVKVSEKMDIAAPFRHMNLTLSNFDQLVIDFYDSNGDLIKRGKFDGYGSEGLIIMK
ncbi:MAG: hypothetical protein WBA54_07625 [Acidaminobacteraceae bacterium]